MLGNSQAIEILEKQRVLLQQFKTRPGFTPEFQLWRRNTRVAIQNIFNSDSHLEEFKSVSFSPIAMVFRDGHSLSDDRSIFLNGIDRMDALLLSFVQEVERYGLPLACLPLLNTKRL